MDPIDEFCKQNELPTIIILSLLEDDVFEMVRTSKHYLKFSIGRNAPVLYEMRLKNLKPKIDIEVDSLLAIVENNNWKEVYYACKQLERFSDDEPKLTYCAYLGKLTHVRILSRMEPPLVLDGIHLEKIAENGHINILEWFLPNNIEHFRRWDHCVVSNASKRADIKVLEWLESKGLLIADRFTTIHPSKNGNLETLKWLEARGILPSFGEMNMACEYGHLNVLKYFATLYILPRKDGANRAAASGHIHVLEWLEKRNILPTRAGVKYACKKGQKDVLIWLEKRHLRPNRDAANYAVDTGDLGFLEWLEEKGVLPDTVGADRAASNGYLNVLIWLSTRNILPAGGEVTTEPNCISGKLDVLQWLARIGILPTPRGARFASLHKNFDITAWLAEKGIFPDY